LSDLSPECTPKRKSVDRSELSVHALELGRSRSQDPLHHRGTHAQCPADLYEAHILLPEAQDALFQFGPAHSRLYVMVSSDSDLDLFGRLINEAGFRARLVYERSLYIESMLLYELRT
jgi:hypothetical protein